MEQIRRQPNRPKGPEAPEPAPLPTVQAQAGALDSLLDSIDEVLSENAEAFVSSFVQKGGQ
jgi:ubiquitin-like protein Pup